MRAGQRFLAWLGRKVDSAYIRATKGNNLFSYNRMVNGIASNNVGEVKFLLESGYDPNMWLHGEPPLHRAARWGHLEVLELLLAAGADPHKLDGTTTYEDVFDEKGEVVDVRPYKGRTPREIAEIQNHPEVAARLKLAEMPEKLPSKESRYAKSLCERFWNPKPSGP